MSFIPEDNNDKVVPPFPYSEEEEKVVELNPHTEKSHKGKGINSSALFTLQKSINGNPKNVRKSTQQWMYLIKNYGEREEGRVYIKVDGARTPIAHILFNDESEHTFRIQCHMQSLSEGDIIPVDVEEVVKMLFGEACELLAPKYKNEQLSIT